MSADLLLAELRRRGVHLVVVDEYRLHWYAPPGALTPALERALHASQPALIQLIRQETVGDARRVPVQPGPPGHVSCAQLAFWRWLAATGRVEHSPEGPPAGPYAGAVANWQHERRAAPR